MHQIFAQFEQNTHPCDLSLKSSSFLRRQKMWRKLMKTHKLFSKCIYSIEYQMMIFFEYFNTSAGFLMLNRLNDYAKDANNMKAGWVSPWINYFSHGRRIYYFGEARHEVQRKNELKKATTHNSP